MTKKYEFTGETKTEYGVVLHRIKAIKDFGDVKKGEIGGWIEKEENLSQKGNVWVCGNAEVFSTSHVMTIGAIGSRNDFTTFYRGKDKKIMVKCGCFNGTIDEFVEKVKKTHGNNKYALVYLSAVETAKLQIDLSDEDAESEV